MDYRPQSDGPAPVGSSSAAAAAARDAAEAATAATLLGLSSAAAAGNWSMAATGYDPYGGYYGAAGAASVAADPSSFWGIQQAAGAASSWSTQVQRQLQLYPSSAALGAGGFMGKQAYCKGLLLYVFEFRAL